MREIPDLDQVIKAARGDPRAIRAERDRLNPCRMPRHRCDRPAILGIPDLEQPLDITRGQAFAVRAPCQVAHDTRVTVQRQDYAHAGGIPNLDGDAVAHSLGQALSIRAPCHTFIREIPRRRRRLLVERLTLQVIPLPAAQLGLAVNREPSVQQLAHAADADMTEPALLGQMHLGIVEVAPRDLALLVGLVALLFGFTAEQFGLVTATVGDDRAAGPSRVADPPTARKARWSSARGPSRR